MCFRASICGSAACSMREETLSELQRSAPQHRPPATMLPRPAVSYSGLATAGAAAVQLRQHRERQRFPSGSGDDREGCVCRDGAQVEAGDDEEREGGRGGEKAWWRGEEEEE